MPTIALTGGIASGKSTVTQLLRELGAHIICADTISRQLTAMGGAALQPIRNAFGDSVFIGETLNRAALGNIVFSDPAKRELLNNIVHPLVYKQLRAQHSLALANNEALIVLDIPLLFETGYNAGADEIWLVDASLDTQLKRLCARDGITQEQALARINAQMPLAQKRALADVIIENHTDFETLKTTVSDAVNRLATNAPGENENAY